MTESLSCGIVVASTRAAAGERVDETGPVIAQWVHDHDFVVEGPHVVADGEPVGQALRTLIEAGCAVVITTGGTGFSPDDQTPEITSALIDRPAPDIAEAIRARGLASTPMAAISRGVAGIAGSTIIVNLAGSKNAVREGLEVLDEILLHALDQLGHRQPSPHEVHP